MYAPSGVGLSCVLAREKMSASCWMFARKDRIGRVLVVDHFAVMLVGIIKKGVVNWSVGVSNASVVMVYSSVITYFLFDDAGVAGWFVLRYVRPFGG